MSVSSAADHWLILEGNDLTVGVDENLALTVYRGPGNPMWSTQESSTPAVTAQPSGGEATRPISLGGAAGRSAERFDDGQFRGHRIHLQDLAGADVELDLILALAPWGELLVEVKQVGGSDTVQSVANLYSWSVKPGAESYLVVPHGSGYMIRCDSPEPVRLSGFVGAAWSLPLFGIVRGDQTCYQVIETWWDAKVSVEHTPGNGSRLTLDWEASLGKLAYPRRVLIRFAENLDHLGMAKAYRRLLIERGELSTLAERAEKLPGLRPFLSGMEYRHVPWDPEKQSVALDNIRRFQESGLPVTFFHPKWPAPGREPGGWQEFLQEEPVPGGWPTPRDRARG